MQMQQRRIKIILNCLVRLQTIVLVTIQDVNTFVKSVCFFNTNFGENAFKDHILSTSGMAVCMTYMKHNERIS